jgi:DNA mismatch repair protein MutH
MSARRTPPPSEAALIARANALVGYTFEDIALALGLHVEADNLRTKGKFGDLIERALGGDGASTATHDFPELQIELKTVPLTPRSTPQESTYVCTVQLHNAEEVPWELSWPARKLRKVLWVATSGSEIPWQQRRVLQAVLWSPTVEQTAQLRADYETAMGLVLAGRIAELTAHHGIFMQVRPKAANSRVLTEVYDDEHGVTKTVPKGFYLRPVFTGSILQQSTAS